MSQDKEFLERYNIKVLSSSKRAAVKVDPALFVEPTNKDIAITINEYRTEPVYTVDIPESSLNMLKQVDEMFFNRSSEVGHRKLFEQIMKQKVEETQLRSKYEAIKQAYEHYSFLLSLAKNGNI